MIKGVRTQIQIRAKLFEMRSNVRFRARQIACARRMSIRARLNVVRSFCVVRSFRAVLRPPLFVSLLVCVMLFSIEAQAQVVAQTENAPPRKFIPEDISSQLDASKNLKERVKLALHLADERIQAAATLTASERYAQAGNELGVYQAIIDDAVRSIHTEGKRKNRDLSKRLEIALRSHLPRIETIRRITPLEEAVHVRDCIEFVQRARTRALEAFFDDTVFSRPSNESGKENEAKEGGAQTGSRTSSGKKPL